MIEDARHIYLVSHIEPDGDSLGSMLGLYWALRKVGKEPFVACPSSLPEIYAFLPGSERIVHQQPKEEELIIVLDSGDTGRLGGLYEERLFSRVPVVNIDHHITNESFGDHNLVDTQVAATAQIVLALLEELDISLDRQIATCLLAGIVYDTQCFRTSNTTSRVLRDAAHLLEYAEGALEEVVKNIFNTKTLSGLHLWGRVLCSIQMEDHIVWAEDTQDMREESQAALDEGSQIVNLLAGIRGAKVALVFSERGDGQIDVSMRGNTELDLSRIALHFGGGGHPRAAGCVVEGSLEDVRQRVLMEVRRALAKES